jgi:DNA-binding NtrC family response regulator
VTIEDLRSTNGCVLNGARVEVAILREHDVIQMGAVELHICGSAEPVRSTRERELSHAAFMITLADELTRARITGRSATVLAIKYCTRSSRVEALRGALAPLDRWCAFAPELDLVLLTEQDAINARHWLDRAGGPNRGEIQVGLANYPTVACGAEDLVDRALHACRSASSGVINEAGVVPCAIARPVLRSPAMLRLYDLVTKAARTTMPILIQGETGSGKELVASALHDKSVRSKAPFKALNCATIPSNLLESVLFGHERGAFTGADRRAPGVFEQAQGGTVLLDEVGELSPQAQAALLRVLEQRCVIRVGGLVEVGVDARVVAATHRDLTCMVRAGTFREDLMFRLDAFTLRVPPLRERQEEIVPLAELFLARAREQWSAPATCLSIEVCEALTAYRWPGNVRQLRNVIERAVAVCAGAVIELDDLTPEVWQESRELSLSNNTEERFLSPDHKDLTFRSLPTRVREFEIERVREALDASGGNHAQAARMLGIPRRTLTSKVHALGL